ncbi:hypothetical protein [Luteimonas aquatica]|uniref:hypothetical protein n=1 Tax=Luteimonas aquatica TaxID=450364 RepID=UPI001F597D1F|nr:hypothetical protein [Luteimonas aquatica]
MVLVHLLLWRMLVLAPPPPHRAPATAVVWIDPPAAPTPLARPPGPSQRRAPAASHRPRPARTRAPRPATATVDAPPPSSGAADILAQAHRWVRANEPIVIAPADPMRSHIPRLPGKKGWLPAPPPPPTLEGIDRGRRMMGEAGYLQDFCARTRMSIAALEPQGDSPELQRQRRRWQAYCR